MGLRRKPAAMAAALVALIGFSVLFDQFYPGGYRHEGLWLVFLVSLYWMTSSAPAATAGKPDRLARAGTLAFLLLLGVQWTGTILKLTDAVAGAPPASRARDFAAFLGTHREFNESVIVADPDYLVDTVSHYAHNRTYLMREQRYGRFTLFTRSSLQSLSLEEILNAARRIRAESGKPVLILLSFKLRPPLSGPDTRRGLTRAVGPQSPRREVTTAGSYSEGYSWKLEVTPAQIEGFLNATELLVEYPPALTDESFDVYVLR
jgi:hypothetical protein